MSYDRVQSTGSPTTRENFCGGKSLLILAFFLLADDI